MTTNADGTVLVESSTHRATVSHDGAVIRLEAFDASEQRWRVQAWAKVDDYAEAAAQAQLWVYGRRA